MNCPKCQAPVSPQEKFCSACGTPLIEENAEKAENNYDFAAQEVTPTNCPRCFNPVKPYEKFCSVCGAPLLKENNNDNPPFKEVYQERGYDEDPYAGKRPPKKVSFSAAVKNYFKNYTNFSGRAVVREYWYVFFFNIIFGLPYQIYSMATSVSVSIYDDPTLYFSDPILLITFLIYFVYLLAAIVPSISLGVRRLHDTGKSGAYMLLMFIPILGPIILLWFFCQKSDGDNQWGPAAE